jgi:hypothetical protein
MRKNDFDRFKLSCQIHNSGHDIKITLYKINQNKLWNIILNQSNFKGRN